MPHSVLAQTFHDSTIVTPMLTPVTHVMIARTVDYARRSVTVLLIVGVQQESGVKGECLHVVSDTR